MFYRRKILLALIEAFGGTLTKTDCQKLIFLFCSRRRKNYYDFFPYRYGNFSLLLDQDRRRLTDLGYLIAGDYFCLQEPSLFLQELQGEDRNTLRALVLEIGDKRGKELLRKVYLEFPYFASRSEIAEKVLTSDEYAHMQQERKDIDASCFFTIGYEGISIDAFLNILIRNNVRGLVDVRKNPISMKYGFSKKRFAQYIALAGMQYFHLPELGIPSDLRQDLTSVSAYQRLFEYYATSLLPRQRETLERLQTITQEHKRVAITCFEADYRFCHRHKIAEYLEQEPSFDLPVIHLQKDCTSGSYINYTMDSAISLHLWESSSE